MGKKEWRAIIAVRPTVNKKPKWKAKYFCIYKVDEISSWIDLLHTFNMLPPSHMFRESQSISTWVWSFKLLFIIRVSEDSWTCLQKNINTRSITVIKQIVMDSEYWISASHLLLGADWKASDFNSCLVLHILPLSPFHYIHNCICQLFSAKKVETEKDAVHPPDPA